MTDRPTAAVLAIDGGNSKAEALLVGPGGQVLAAARSGTVSHQQVGLPAALSGIVALAAAVARAAGLPADAPTSRRRHVASASRSRAAGSPPAP